MASRGRLHYPACRAAHDVVNKLSAIVGNCDLLSQMTEKGTEYSRRLAVIRDLAESAAKELTEHQKNLETETRDTGLGGKSMI
jgi:hypothetical protein